MLCCVIALCSCASKRIVEDGFFERETSPGTGILHLHCTFTEPHCGGVELTPDEMPKPHPWSGRLYVRPARPESGETLSLNRIDVPVRDTIIMDAKGDGYLRLPVGEYLLLDKEHVDDRMYKRLLRDHRDTTPYYTAIDVACIRKWLYGPFATITISASDTTHLEHPQMGKCSWYSTPCVQYFGPTPP